MKTKLLLPLLLGVLSVCALLHYELTFCVALKISALLPLSMRSTIEHLFSAGSPLNIAGFIMAVIIFTVYSMSRTWLWTKGGHVLVKRLESKLYTATSVISEMLVARVYASIFSRHIAAVFPTFRASASPSVLGAKLVPQTAATFARPSTQLLGSNEPDSSAIALARPHDAAIVTMQPEWNRPQSKPATEKPTGQIREAVRLMLSRAHVVPLYLLMLTLAMPSLVGAQNVRFDQSFPSISNLFPYYLTANVFPNSPVLAVCHSPANQVPCTNYAQTMTSLGANCPSGAQDTPQPQPSTCQPTGDAQGNIGFWAPIGTYDYTVCVQNNCFGPYTVTLGGTSGAAQITVNGGSVITSPVNFSTSSPAAPTNGLNVAFQNSGSNVSAAIVGDGNAKDLLIGTGVFSPPGVVPRAAACASNLDTIATSDRGGYVSWSDASPCTVTLPQAGTAGYAFNFVFVGCELGTGSAVITPTISTITYTAGSRVVSGASSMTLQTGQCAFVYSDNANYTAMIVSNLNIGTTTPQIGDILRYNVNGDSAWDAVNYSQSVIGLYAVSQLSTLQAFGAFGSSTISVTNNSSSTISPTAISQAGSSYGETGGNASLNTVIGANFGENGSTSTIGMQAFYRWSFKAALGGLTTSRYWFGLACHTGGGTGNNGAAIVGTTAYASDTPNKSTEGFLYSAGQAGGDFQAVAVTAGGSQTNVDTHVVADTSPHLFEMTTNSTGTSILYWIDGTNVATISTNLPPPANNANSWGDLFFTGDNKNSTAAISLIFYSMQISLK